MLNNLGPVLCWKICQPKEILTEWVGWRGQSFVVCFCKWLFPWFFLRDFSWIFNGFSKEWYFVSTTTCAMSFSVASWKSARMQVPCLSPCRKSWKPRHWHVTVEIISSMMSISKPCIYMIYYSIYIYIFKYSTSMYTLVCICIYIKHIVAYNYVYVHVHINRCCTVDDIPATKAANLQREGDALPSSGHEAWPFCGAVKQQHIGSPWNEDGYIIDIHGFIIDIHGFIMDISWIYHGFILDIFEFQEESLTCNILGSSFLWLHI